MTTVLVEVFRSSPLPEVVQSVTTVIEVYREEPPVVVAGTVLVEAVGASNEVESTDPITGKPYAVMAIQGRNLYVSPTPPPAGQYVGDLWIPLP